MSITEREVSSSAAAQNTEGAVTHAGLGMPIPDALDALRRRILLYAFLRWYWIGALACDALVLLAAALIPHRFARADWTVLTAVLLVAPLVIGLARCFTVRVPAESLARLIDTRAHLQERVATSLEYAQRAQVNAQMTDLLSTDAISALSDTDLRPVVPIRRDIYMAAAALSATLALCYWHAPEVIGAALAGRGGDSGSSSPVLAERRVIPIGEPQRGNAPAKQSSPSIRKPSAKSAAAQQHSQSAEQSKVAQPPASKPKVGTTPGQQSNTNTNNGGSDSGQGDSGQSKTDLSQSSPGGGAKSQSQQGSNSTGKKGAWHGKGSTSPPAQSKKGRGTSAPANQHKTGNGQSKGKTKSENASGDKTSANHGQGSGQKRSGDAHQGSQGAQPSHQGESGQKGHGQGQGSSSEQGSSNLSAAPGPGGTGQAGQNGQRTSSGQDSRNNPGGGPGAPTGEKGGIGKPRPIQPRDLPPVANRSTYSFRLSKPSNSRQATLSGLDRGKPNPKSAVSGGSQVPYGSGSVSAGAPAQEREVEQDPRIPAAYRQLVKRYFAQGSNGSNSKGRTH